MFKYSKANNFDLIRLILAVLVLLQHTYNLTQNEFFLVFQTINNWVKPVYCFFIISGFLIAASYERSLNLNDYFEKRIRRIFPAYLFVVLFWAFSCAFLTKVDLRQYFSFDWIKFLIANLTFLNFLHETLP